MNHVRTILLIMIFFWLAMLHLACKKPTGPSNGPTPGKRDYVWTIDTLTFPQSFQVLMRDIWASSPTDVYVVGHNDRAGLGTMFRFDGTSWTPIRLHASEGGTIQQGFDLSAIYGFAPNDIYAVGNYIYANPTPPPNFLDSSLIIHFDGNQWREVQVDVRGRHLSCIWGANTTDVWFGGSQGTLYRYNNSTVANKTPFDSLTSFAFMTGFSASDVYATCTRKIDFVSPEDSSLYLLFYYDGQNWTPVDSFIISPQNLTWKFGLSLWGSENGRLYSATYGVYLFQSGVWNRLLASDWPVRVRGSNEQNIFAVGGLGRIFHWNGMDWIRFTQIEDPNKSFFGTWTNNVETFIVGNDGLTTFVIHGR